LLGEECLMLIKQMINNTRETAEWPKDFIGPKSLVLKEKSEATKCRDHCTFNVSVYTAKKVARILRRRSERKIRDVLGEDQFRMHLGW